MRSKSDKKKSLVPRLRFPEFREAGAWEVKRLGDVAALKNGYAFKSSKYSDNGAYKVVTIANVQAGHMSIEDMQRISPLPSDLQTHQKLSAGDILISMTGNVGRICYVLIDDCLLNQRVGKLVPTKIDKEFFYHSIQNGNFQTAMQERAKGGAQGNLSAKDILQHVIYYPNNKHEQQKIAHCLSSLDEVIGLQAKKVQALKQHKKGLMQQLFPAEGETTPRLRFPEFREAGAWEVRRLGEIGKISKGKGISKSDIKPNGALPCIRYGELYTHYGEVIRDVVSFTDANPGNLVLSEENDVIIPASGETKEDIATASCVSVKGVALGGDLNIFYSPMNGMFLAYYIRGNLKFEISKVAQGNSVVHLYTTQLEKLKLAVPPYPKEQQKIAHCLSSLDEVIGLESDKLDALKNLKKGLMQQLFPQEVA